MRHGYNPQKKLFSSSIHLSIHHPSIHPSILHGALVGAGSLSPTQRCHGTKSLSVDTLPSLSSSMLTSVVLRCCPHGCQHNVDVHKIIIESQPNQRVDDFAIYPVHMLEKGSYTAKRVCPFHFATSLSIVHEEKMLQNHSPCKKRD